jgi:hypothetical protein
LRELGEEHAGAAAVVERPIAWRDSGCVGVGR